MAEFIKNGKFDKEFGKLFSDLFDWRQEGDYSDFVSFDRDLTIPLINKTEAFIILIEAFLKSTEMPTRTVLQLIGFRSPDYLVMSPKSQ